jgi:iron complex transport system ATP-binding protein
MISIKNLSFNYGKQVIFDQLNLDIPSNSFVSIIGPNGCGKSTLLKLIGRDLNYKQGKIEIEGKSLCDYSTKDYSKLTAFNRQQVIGLFPFTCLDYLLMGRRPYHEQFEDYDTDDLQLVESVLKMTDTTSFIEKKLNEISGGELQRINLAKIFIQDTPIMLLDESFSAMDIYHTIESLQMLKSKVTNNKSVICVMHDLNLVYQYSDFVILLKNGKVHTTGAPTEVLSEYTIKEVYGINVEYIKNKGFIFRGGRNEENSITGMG